MYIKSEHRHVPVIVLTKVHVRQNPNDGYDPDLHRYSTGQQADDWLKTCMHHDKTRTLEGYVPASDEAQAAHLYSEIRELIATMNNSKKNADEKALAKKTLDSRLIKHI